MCPDRPGPRRRVTFSPVFLLWLNRILKWVWLALMPVMALVPSLKTNVTVVIELSLYANMAANWSAERGLEAQLEARRGAEESEKQAALAGAKAP